MPGLHREKSEAFVKHLGAGLAPKDAARAAGYSTSWAYKVAQKMQRADIKGMIAKRQWEAARESADLTPVIKALMDAGSRAAALGSAAGLVAAKGLYAEAARLKGRPSAPAEPPAPRQPEMTEDEWLAAFAPDAERLP